MATGESTPARSVQLVAASEVDTVEVAEGGKSSEPFEVGQALGRYVILQRAGAGGMAVVYAAYDPELDRKVAIKVLRTQDETVTALDQEKTLDYERARALREAQALAKLSHPNVLPVFDVGTLQGRVWFATEYVDGCTLKEWLHERPRPYRERLEVMKAAGKGLAAAHAQGFVHRDFKPQNVMIGRDGQVRVMDFGLVRQGEGHGDQITSDRDEDSVRSTRSSESLSEGLTGSNLVMGTPHYMAPEQHNGMMVDARADQYSFCVSLYEALWGIQPFKDLRPEKLLRAKQRMKYATGDRHDVPRWLAKIVLRGMHPNPAARWPSMDALLDALQRDPVQRRRRWLTAAGLAALLGTGGAAYAEYRQKRAAVCSGGAARLAGVWDRAQANEIRTKFIETGLPYAADTWSRVKERVDDYRHAWLAMHRDACEATEVRHEQSSEMLDARMACLDGHLRELRALTEVFVEANPTVVRNAAMATMKLPPLEACGDLEALKADDVSPPPPEATAQVKRLTERLAFVNARRKAGKIRAAEEEARRILEDVRTLDYEPLDAKARLELGGLLMAMGRVGEAEELMVEAALMAEANGMLDEAYRARSALVYVVGYGLGRYDEAQLWARLAEALLGRLPEPGRRRVQLELNRGVLLATRGKDEQAYDVFVALSKGMDRNNPDLPIVLNNAGLTAIELGRLADASRHLEESIAAGRRLFGPSHPSIGLAVSNRGKVLVQQKRFEEAKSVLRESMRIFEQAGAAESVHAADVHASLAEIASASGRHEEAIDDLLRARKIVMQSSGKGHFHYARVLMMLGNEYETAAKLGLALEHYREALSVCEEAGLQATDTVGALVAIGRVLAKLEQPTEASGTIGRARGLARDQALPPELSAELDFAQALTLALNGAGRDAPCPYANRAIETLLTLPHGQGNDRAEEIRAWAAKHECRVD